MIQLLLNRLLFLVLALVTTELAEGFSSVLPSAEASVIIDVDPFSDYNAYGLSPFWKWKTIETANFRVIFPVELTAIANRTSNLLEEAHKILSPVLQWQPATKVQVVLIDNQDSGNGLTAAFERFGIILWVTPPDTNFSTAYYDDWLRFLVIHEYTHYLNLDATSGIWKPLRYIFGDTLLPNSAWPRWMLEGLAIYMETRFTSAGRGRSTYYDMMVRAGVESKTVNTRDFITLDKVNGTNPYFPVGDTPYEWGYQLMHQIGRENDNEFTLGKLSIESSYRIPFFINGNLENVTRKENEKGNEKGKGKDFYATWNDWLEQTHMRAEKDLATIRREPVTQYTLLTQRSHENSNDVEGATVSPDGKWIAYSMSNTHHRPGLYLKNLKTGEVKHIDDKLGGMGMKFTPDSQGLIVSQLLQDDPYYLYSDLVFYFIKNEGRNITRIQLSRHLRARDPDLSPDGKWVAFTYADHGFTGLARAPLLRDPEHPNTEQASLGPMEKLFEPQLFDHVGPPRYSIDGEKIYFSFHPNGKSQEDLLEYHLKSKKITSVVSDGYYNRYPAQKENGELYYVSNATGVDNLYRINLNQSPEHRTGPVRVSNMTTGIGFPTWGPVENGTQTLYASVFSFAGWDLAKIETPDHPFSDVKISVPPAPPIGAHSKPETENKSYPIHDYSVFPSIWPRTWSPLFGLDSKGYTLGGEVVGYDAVDLHRYILAGTYSSSLKVGEGLALYSNRTLGAAIDLQADYLTQSAVFYDDNSANYTRQLDLLASISYPWTWTYASLTPTLGVASQRLFDYFQLPGGPTQLIATSPIVPSVYALLSYSNAETSPLAITSEGGRFAEIGGRVYFDTASNQTIFKLLGLYQEYIEIANHHVIFPTLKGQWVSQVSSNFPSANANLLGRGNQFVLGNSLGGFWGLPYGDTFNQLAIRGYPYTSFSANAVATASLDYQFPILRIFGGWGTNPAFLDNLYGRAFIETSWSPGTLWLPSVGGALRLSTELFFIPITLSLDYQEGLNTAEGGARDLFFQTLVNFSF